MKLSEAILLGSAHTAQGFGYKSIYSESVNKCALGAALCAIGKESSLSRGYYTPYQVATDEWPWAHSTIVTLEELPESFHRATHGLDNSVLARIWQLNDLAKWTRPQIAAWVAELEVMYDGGATAKQQESGKLLKEVPHYASK